MKKAIVYFILLLLINGVTQAVSEEQSKLNKIVVDDIDSIQVNVLETLEQKDSVYREDLQTQSIAINNRSEFKLFLIGFCLCIFLIPIITNLIRVKINEKRVKFYMDNIDVISK